MKGKLLFVFFGICVWLFSAKVQAQFCENAFKGAFTIDPADGCVQKAVTLKNDKSGAQDVYYVYNFNRTQTDAPVLVDRTPDLSYVYTKPGTYTILQAGSASGTGFVLCKDYKVRETAAPNGYLTSCNNGRVRLTLVDDAIYRAYDKIEIDWGDGPPIRVDKGGLLLHDKIMSQKPSITIKGVYNGDFCASEVKSRTLTGEATPPSLASIKISNVEMTADGKAKILYQGMEGVNTEVFIDKGDAMFVSTGKTASVKGPVSVTIENLNPDQIYRFKLISKDICENPSESNIVSSVIVKKGTLVLDEVNSVTWEQRTNSEKLVEFQLLRDDGVIFNTPSELSYLDDKVKCGTDYKYAVVAVIEGDVRSYSAPITIRPQSSSPEAIKQASVTVESNNLITSKIVLSGDGLTSTYNLIVERANSGSSDFQKVSGLSNQNLIYKDQEVNTSETSYCYRFSYENACKLVSPPSDVICSILLKSGVQDISWTGASPFIGSVGAYDLIQTDINGQTTDEIPKQLDLIHKIDLDTQSAGSFQIRAESGNGNLVSYSNVISLRSDVIMLIPDIFTPNGDGINERFEVKSYFTTTFRMLIYSRWGEVVFQSENALDGWDGTIGGKPALPGYYLYKIEASTPTQEQISRTGSFVLVR
ncbi:T9SS type B sorting domain-containing protein [Dyadobacter psychrotolerans]|nr:gliding motility-associated C-terminal domain-containing protein [Dyadobacter psychrotolerans]